MSEFETSRRSCRCRVRLLARPAAHPRMPASLAPLPVVSAAVEGYSTPGGYSSKAVKPIALAKCMSIAQVRRGCSAAAGKAHSSMRRTAARRAALLLLCGSVFISPSHSPCLAPRDDSPARAAAAALAAWPRRRHSPQHGSPPSSSPHLLLPARPPPACLRPPACLPATDDGPRLPRAGAHPQRTGWRQHRARRCRVHPAGQPHGAGAAAGRDCDVAEAAPIDGHGQQGALRVGPAAAVAAVCADVRSLHPAPAEARTRLHPCAWCCDPADRPRAPLLLRRCAPA